MAEHLRCEQQPGLRPKPASRRARASTSGRSLDTVLRRSAQCLRIAPRDRSDGGAPTHRIIFTYRDGDEVPEAGKKLTRAFGLGFAIVLSMRSARYLCRVFAVSGTHAGGATSLHFTVSLREFGADNVRWRARPQPARRSRPQAHSIGATLPLPL